MLRDPKKVVYLLVIFVVFENIYKTNYLLLKKKTYRCFATFSKCTLNLFKWPTNAPAYSQITFE